MPHLLFIKCLGCSLCVGICVLSLDSLRFLYGPLSGLRGHSLGSPLGILGVFRDLHRAHFVGHFMGHFGLTAGLAVGVTLGDRFDVISGSLRHFGGCFGGRIVVFFGSLHFKDAILCIEGCMRIADFATGDYIVEDPSVFIRHIQVG